MVTVSFIIGLGAIRVQQRLLRTLVVAKVVCAFAVESGSHLHNHFLELVDLSGPLRLLPLLFVVLLILSDLINLFFELSDQVVLGFDIRLEIVKLFLGLCIDLSQFS